ncbi:unnamed protein product, partial [Polarella glacialis]
GGTVIAGHVNGPLWEPNAKRPCSDLHAEVNAIGLCARRGFSTEGSTLYVTMPPCKRCFMQITAAGIRRIVTRKEIMAQDAKDVTSVARRLGIAVAVVADTEVRRKRLDRLANESLLAAESTPDGTDNSNNSNSNSTLDGTDKSNSNSNSNSNYNSTNDNNNNSNSHSNSSSNGGSNDKSNSNSIAACSGNANSKRKLPEDEVGHEDAAPREPVN